MSSYLLDSDVLIWHLRGKEKIRDLVVALGASALLHCSILSVIEIEAGLQSSEEDKTREFIAGLQIEPIDLRIANRAGAIIREYRGKGQTLNIVDAVIAATALERRHVLVSANVRHYPMPEIEVLEAKL